MSFVSDAQLETYRSLLRNRPLTEPGSRIGLFGLGGINPTVAALVLNALTFLFAGWLISRMPLDRETRQISYSGVRVTIVLGGLAVMASAVPAGLGMLRGIRHEERT